MARKSVTGKGEFASVSYKKINQIVSAVSAKFPAEAAVAALSDAIGQVRDYLVQ